MDILNLVIKTKRLALVPITYDYVDVIFKNFTKEITVYMYPQPSGNKKDTINFIDRSIKTMKEGSNIQLVIKHKHTDEYIGNVGLHHIDTKTPELGIWVKKSAHGCAYGNEAIEALIDFANNNLDFDYLKYPVDRNNIPSRKIPIRQGAKVEKEYVIKNEIGKELDILEYRIYKK